MERECLRLAGSLRRASRDDIRMSLTTAGRVRVELDSAQRTVDIVEGEVLFEVAKDAHRPFVVRAAGSEVVALGTVFSVRLAPNGQRVRDALAVTLIEGQVTVRPATDRPPGGAAPARPVLLHPGDRVRLGEVADSPRKDAESWPTEMDRPRLEQVTAWTRSQAVFDDTSLSDAVAEMNRYSRVTIDLHAHARPGRAAQPPRARNRRCHRCGTAR